MLSSNHFSGTSRVCQKLITRLPGCEINSMRPIFKTEMLIYKAKANFDEKILFGNITHHLGPVHTGTQSFRSISFRSEKWNAQGLRSHGNA